MFAGGAWQPNLYDAAVAAASVVPSATRGIDTGAKLYVSNLDFGVSQEDVKVRLSEFSFEILCPSVLVAQR